MDFPGARVLVNLPAAEQGFTPNAVLLHGRLTGRVDSDWLLKGAFEDSRRLPCWAERETSTLDFLGCRSAFVCGTYAVDSWVLQATTRYLVVDDESGQYLTQLTLTRLSSQVGDLDTDVTVINLGLQVLRH
ncbi:putative lipoprotein LpqN [Rhodococcus sp. AG1013]|nr:putative lipoprotein LpqN [Rhodococcus sp. AG1013]